MEYRRIRKDRDKLLGIFVANDEKELIARAAKVRDQNLSEFCREVLIENSTRITE